MQKVIINPGKGGEDFGIKSSNIIEKDFNLAISKAIFRKLKEMGIATYLVRDDDRTLSDRERIEIINSYIDKDDEVIILTNMLGDGMDQGAEIIYALRNKNTLANEISLNLERVGQNVLKYYQLRDPGETAKDYYDIIKNTGDYESIIVSYGYPNNQSDNLFLEANLENLAQGVAKGINDYLKKSNFYVVKSGDSLYQIAQKYMVSVEDLKELNGLSLDTLEIGSTLLIPIEKENASSYEFIYYSVQKGDNLYSIARKFNTTINVIKEINDLTSNNLDIGEVLKIPKKITDSDMENYLIYQVQKGDNLYGISKKYQVSVSEIKNLNGLSSNNLQIGDMLKIPKR